MLSDKHFLRILGVASCIPGSESSVCRFWDPCHRFLKLESLLLLFCFKKNKIKNLGDEDDHSVTFRVSLQERPCTQLLHYFYFASLTFGKQVQKCNVTVGFDPLLTAITGMLCASNP